MTNWPNRNTAASQGYIEVVRLLLQKGGDINIEYEEGGKALRKARNSRDIV